MLYHADFHIEYPASLSQKDLGRAFLISRVTGKRRDNRP